MAGKKYTKTFKTIAKKSGKSTKDMNRYWGYGKQAVKREKAKGKKIKDENAYTQAVALRCAQRTGPRPHKPLSKKKRVKKIKEAFELKVDQIIEEMARGDNDYLVAQQLQKWGIADSTLIIQNIHNIYQNPPRVYNGNGEQAVEEYLKDVLSDMGLVSTTEEIVGQYLSDIRGICRLIAAPRF